VLLNVFLAIAVDNISLEDDENKAEEEAAATETGYVVPMNLISVVIRERNIGIITSFFEVKPVFLKPK